MPIFAAEKIILAHALPEYVNDRGFETLFGIPLPTGYRLARAGLLRTIYIREKGRKSAQRLWDCASIRKLLNEQPQEAIR